MTLASCRFSLWHFLSSKKKDRKKTRSGRALCTFVSLLIGSALFFTEPSYGCELPVCDIEAQLKLFKDNGQAYRFETLSQLRNKYARENDEAKLNNLLVFARRATAIVAQLKDEDYVLRESKLLKDQSLFLLVKWVWRDCTRLSDAYGDLAGEGQRFAALDFFLTSVPERTNQSEIENLVCFAQAAEKKSRAIDDPDYIARHAQTLASALSMQLLEVFNGWEGAFQIVSIEGPLNGESKQLKLVLFSTGGSLGIVAALTHPTLPPVVFQSVSFQGQPQTLVSRQSLASQVPSVLELSFDRSFERVEGSILDAIKLQKIRFHAQRQVGVPSWAKRPCSASQVLGQYRVSVSGQEGVFSLQAIAPHQYAAVFSTPDGSFRLPFAYGRYNETSGRLTFVNLQANVPVAWRLSAEQEAGGRCHLRGFGLSSFNAAVYPLLLVPVD